MQKITIFRMGFVFLIIPILIISCEKNKDSDPPSISITSHTGQSQVWNIVRIELNVQDNKGISRVVFMVEGTEIETLTAPPWEVNWNTREYTDGPVTVSFKAYDNSGNESQAASMTLIIKNTLLKVSIEEGYLSKDTEGIWSNKMVIILMSEDRVILGSALIGNGESQVIKRPSDFNGETFDLIRGMFESRADDASYFYGYLYHYMDMMPGELDYTLSTGGYDRGGFLGECYFVAGDIPSLDYDILTYGNRSSFGNMHTDSARVGVYQNQRDAYYYLRNGGSGVYRFFEGLEANRVYTVNYKDLSDNMQVHSVNFPAGQYEYIHTYVYALPQQEFYDLNYAKRIYDEYVDPATQPHIQFHYPVGHSAIQDFRFFSYANPPDGKWHEYIKYGSLPYDIPLINTTISDFSLDLPGSLTGVTSGSADIQCAYLSFRTDNGSIYFYLRGPMGKSLRLPGFPSDIRNRYNIPDISNANMSYSYYYLSDYSTADDYQTLAGQWSGLHPSDGLISSGTEILYTGYDKYAYPQKKSVRMEPMLPEETNTPHHVGLIDK